MIGFDMPDGVPLVALQAQPPVPAQVRRDGDRWVATIGKRRFSGATHAEALAQLFQGISLAVRRWAEAPDVPESRN